MSHRLRGGKGTGFVGSPWATENPVTRFPLGEVPRSGQGGAHFHARKGGWPVFPRAKPGCKGFIQTGAFNYFKRRPPKPSAAKPLSILRTLGAKAPSNLRTLTPKGRVHKAAHHNPRAKGASNLGPKGRQPSRPQGVSIIKNSPKRAVSYFLITRDGRPAWGRRNGGWCPRSGRCRFCSGEPG